MVSLFLVVEVLQFFFWPCLLVLYGCHYLGVHSSSVILHTIFLCSNRYEIVLVHVWTAMRRNIYEIGAAGMIHINNNNTNNDLCFIVHSCINVKLNFYDYETAF